MNQHKSCNIYALQTLTQMVFQINGSKIAEILRITICTLYNFE